MKSFSGLASVFFRITLVFLVWGKHNGIQEEIDLLLNKYHDAVCFHHHH